METKQKLKEIFSSNLQMYLTKSHKSQADLCNDLGFTSSTVSDWINAKKYPRMDKVQAIADYFHIMKSDLTDEHNTNSSSLEFSTVEEAMQYILRMPVVSAYGGYDLDKMSDEEIIQFANKLTGVFKMLAEEYKK